MKYIVSKKVALSRPPEDPLPAYIGSFTDRVSEQAYAEDSLCHRVHLAACFSGWLRKKGIRLRGVSSEHPVQYLRHRARRRYLGRSDAAALRDFIGFLQRQDVIPAEKEPLRRLTPVEECVRTFEQYLSEECTLASATVGYYVRFVRRFLHDQFGRGRVTLASFCSETRESTLGVGFSGSPWS